MTSQHASGALAGVRVLDLTTGIAGSVASMLLADLGAEAIKVRAPGEGPAPERPALYVFDRNKISAVLDRSVDDDLEALDRLVDGADLVMTGPGGHGVSERELRQREHLPGQPALWISMPAYLPGGAPWGGERESAGSIMAWFGHAWNQASYEDVPVDCVYPVALHMQGIWAATNAVAMLAGRQAGRNVPPLAIVGGAHGGMLVSPGAFAIAPDEPHAHRPGGPGGTLPNYRCYRCGDGTWLFFGAFTSAFIRRGLKAVGASHLLADPRIGGDPDRIRLPENITWVTRDLERLFETRPRDEWLKVLQSADVPSAPALRTSEWLEHEQIRAMGLRAEVRDDAGTRTVMPGLFLTLSDTPGSLRYAASAVPQPVSALAGRWERRPARRPAASRPAEPPLGGTRVIDLGTIIAGPYAAALLHDLGAEVIKVERPPHGDAFRVAHGGRGGAGFPVYDRGRPSLMLDIADQGGRDVFLRLARLADVVVDNYRPGVLDRLGIGHRQLAAVNSRISSVSISAFGGAGPLGRQPGFDPVVQAMSGIMRSQGGPDEADSPVFLTIPINDVISAGLGALGSCAALFARTRTGRGQEVSVTLCAASCLVQAEHLAEHDGRQAVSVLGGRDTPGPGPLNRFYPALDGWVRIDGRWPGDVPKLTAAGLAADLGEAISPGRVAETLATQIGLLPVAEVISRCARAGVPAVKARKMHEVASDAQLIENGLLIPALDHRGHAKIFPGRWLDMPGLTLPPPSGAPMAGQDSAVILHEAGIPPAEIARLIQAGVAAEHHPASADD